MLLLAALIGIQIWFVAVEPDTVVQLVPKLVLSEFVCICNRQPVKLKYVAVQ